MIHSVERFRRQIASGICGEFMSTPFLVLPPDTTPFVEQVASFKGATRVVGVMGSALANLAFASPGTEVFVLAPDVMPDNFFWFLSAHRGLALTEIRCETAPPRTGHHVFDLSVRLDASDKARVLDLTTKRLPSPPWFDPTFYLARYADVAAAGVDPLLHYSSMDGERTAFRQNFSTELDISKSMTTFARRGSIH